MTLTPLVFAATAAWHALAAWHFTLYPERTLKRTTTERPPNAFAVELFRFLGGLNLALTALGVAACFDPAATIPAAVALAIANGTQAAQDLRVQRAGLASGFFFRQILVGDVFFTVANAAVVVAAILARR